MHKVLIFGSRKWTDRDAIERLILELLEEHHRNDLLVIEGKARGADTIAGEVAKDHGIHVAEIGALWDFYKYRAGPKRNDVMASLKPDEAYGFAADLSDAPGTSNMLSRCHKHGIPVEIRNG